MKINPSLFVVLVLFGSIQGATFSQDTATVTQGDLAMQVNLPGVFVADDKDEIKMEPSKYRGELVVTYIRTEGESVRQGDILIAFDTNELDDAIEEAQNEATDADVEFQKANAEFESARIDLDSRLAQLKTELSFLELEVEAAIARQALELAEKERAVAISIDQIADTRIDLDTLIQIYQERNLQTSTSGEILIEREKSRIRNEEIGLDFERKELEYFKKFDKSRAQLEKELEVEKKLAEIKKEKVTLEAAVAEKESVVIKAKRKFDAAQRKVDGLKLDRESLQVASPRDGVLFYGATGNEMPSGVIIIGGGDNDIRKELRVGGRVKTHSVLLTVATMENLSIKMSVSEDDIQHLKNELKITVHPDAFPSQHFAGNLTRVDPVATKASFSSSEGRFKVMGKCTDDAPMLRSGMNCRVEIHAEPIEDAILAPVNSVFSQGDAFFCYLKNGANVEKREVTLGQSNPNLVEVTNGLEAGDEVYLILPEKQK